MNILGLDTSSTACSVALLISGKLAERHVKLENRHSEHVLKFVQELIIEAGFNLEDLDAIAVGNGPGSFTGLRLGMGVAQGLAFGINKPIITVSSLRAIATASSAKNILVAVDARMGEVYWQCFQSIGAKEPVAVDSIKLNCPESIVLAQQELDWQGIGSGFDHYTEQLTKKLKKQDNWIKGVHPHASSIIKLALAEIQTNGMPKDNSALPIYIRDKVTQ